MRRLLSILLLYLLTNSAFSAEPQLCPINPTNQKPTCVTTPMSDWAKLLGWTPSTPSPSNICGGYYAEPAEITAHPNPLPIADMQMDITSTGPAVYSPNNFSTLEGDVTLTQPGRAINADKVILIPNPDTGQTAFIDLQGHVRYQEASRLMVGESARIDMEKSTLVVNKGAYHMTRQTEKNGVLNVWGTADEGHRDSPTYSWYKRATYTTCQPTDPSWNVKSKNLTLDKEAGRGVAKHAVLYAKKVPIFYLPYMSFPIDKRRYSGFLYPDFGYDSQSGSFISVPYYFNLAPNYDDTLTITPMSKRGVMVDNLFRYLTPHNSGTLELSYLPGDRAFENFKIQTAQLYPPSYYNTPFLNDLNSSSNNRGSIAFHDDTRFNEHWSAVVDINRVTDDYYFQDFGSNFTTVSTNQLFNQAAINYQAEHWQWSGRVEDWQTLHPIDQTFAQDQYSRLPQFSFATSWPDSAYGLSYSANGEWVNFAHSNDFFTNVPYPNGNRIHFNPQVSFPMNNSGAFLTPALAIDMTAYDVNNNGVLNIGVYPPTIVPDANPNLREIRTLPIFSLDGGLYLDKFYDFGKNGFQQTLEPRLFYLYVPPEDQNNIPIFDTTLPPFSFNELYRTNRFMGYDRVGDANQLSMGFTTRLLDGYSGAEKINASLGAIYYFRKHTVCIYENCQDDPAIDDRISPIAGQLTYIINPATTLTANAAWDANQSQMNNDALTLQYRPDAKRLLSATYTYIQGGDPINPNPESPENNFQRINLSLTWPITENWNVIGNWNYNISHAHPETYLYGLEYENCCWAVRLVSSRILEAENVNDELTFRSAYYLQFVLKGLASVGQTGGSSLLRDSIPGYTDIF